MNSYDRKNFEFLMSMSPDEMLKFFEDMPPDDIYYAIELIQMARSEVIIQQLEHLESEETDLADARNVLTRIMSL